MLKLRSATAVALASVVFALACQKTNDVKLKNENACLLESGEEPAEGAKLVQCTDSCIDLNSNEENCGECEHACVDGATCVEGECSCPYMEDVCDDRCVNISTDAQNCGGCGGKCAEGATCDQFFCSCPGSEQVCNDKCVDTNEDEQNCGTCGNACKTGDTCLGGQCQCAGKVCDGECKDTSSDAGNCGSCGNACEQGKACEEGSCACPNGGDVCEGECADFQNDKLNCGECGKVCDNVCTAGGCVDVRTMWAGNGSTCAGMDDDSVWCWGVISNEWINLRPTRHTALEGATRISGGSSHNCAQFASSVACWGTNDSGELGRGEDGSTEYQASPLPVVSLTESDDVQFVGTGSGEAFNCVTLNEGTSDDGGFVGRVLCWGKNDAGQTGQPVTTATVPTPTAVPGVEAFGGPALGAAHVCVYTTTSGVQCWGSNSEGQLGRTLAVTSDPTPDAVYNLSGGARELVAGGNFTCALYNSDNPDEVRCWGGAPVASDWVPSVVSGFNGEEVAHIAAGTAHVCAVTTPGSVYCWGEGNSARIGSVVTTNTPVKVELPGMAVGVTAGPAHSCAWLQDGRAYCWGSNSSGQIGNGESGVDKFDIAPVRVVF